jgi:hypothetical protein
MGLPHFGRIPVVIPASTHRNKYKEKPSPSEDDLKNPLFEPLFQLIKNWDIRVPEYDALYSSGNGSHVKMIMDAIIPQLRDKKIDDLLEP